MAVEDLINVADISLEKNLFLQITDQLGTGRDLYRRVKLVHGLYFHLLTNQLYQDWVESSQVLFQYC